MIAKPFNDKCNYETFQLENKLNVFLIEDPNADVACGTMLVKIGHDHDTVLGIAHFLEHMLFNGTSKYPDENMYSSYINNNGGMNNAYTDHDHTCYFFTIQPDCLEKSLDMFGNFFISPLLNPDSVDREKNAVDSEHIKNIGNDAWRIQEIMRTAVSKTNPLKNFGTGSAKTLAIPDIDKKVRHFFEQYYSSHLMTLFVVTKNNANKIKSEIYKIFSQIKYNPTPENSQYFGIKMYDYPKIIEVVPIKKIEKMTISWDLPSYKHSPSRSPYNFLSHLLGHEGKNTIHFLLSQLGYITSLYSGTEIFQNDRCTFSVSVEMTPVGVTRKDDILITIIEYIKLIKNKINCEHLLNLYNEQMTLNAFNFKYSIKSDPCDRTLEYARLVNTYDFDLKDILMIPYAKENFSPNVKANLFDVLNLMTIEKSVVLIVSKSYDGLTNHIDEDYGTNYNIYNDYPNLTATNIDTSLLDLPNINKFISVGEHMTSTHFAIPEKVISDVEQTNKLELYHLPTNEFATPDICVKAIIYLPISIESAENYVKSILYFTSLLSEINHEKYMCATANYNTGIYFDQGKLYIDIFGNYDKITEVCEFLIISLLNKNLITEKIFNSALYALEMASLNTTHSSPYLQTNNIFRKTMFNNFYNNHDILKVINDKNINIDNVRSILDKILMCAKCKVLVSGNTNSFISNKIASLLNKFGAPNQISFDESLYDTFKIPTDEKQIITKNVENPLESNTAVLYNVFISKMQYGKTLNWNKQLCMLNLLDAIISTEYFDQLRTKEGFGYVVNSRNYSYSDDISHTIRYYGFTVQSPHKHHDEIIKRTETFISECVNYLETITEEKLKEVSLALISQLDSSFNNLIEKSDFIFKTEILSGLETFDFRNKLIQTYSNVTLQEFKNFYKTKLFENKNITIITLVGNK